MNSYTYPSFKDDMREAVNNFVEDTAYEISFLSDSTIHLKNSKYVISFSLEGANLNATINTIVDNSSKAFYELFEEKGILNQYPKNLEQKLSYEEFNKHKVQLLLKFLTTDFKRFIHE